MLRLDLPTLATVLIVLGIAMGAPLAAISGPRRGTGALWYWALALLALAGGGLLLVARGIIPPIISVMFGNALIVYTLVQAGETASCLTNSSLDHSHRRFFALLTAPLLGVLFLTVDPIWPRVAYMAALEAYLVGQLAWQFHRASAVSGERPYRSVFAFEVLLWCLLAETIIRTVAVLMLTPTEPFFAQTVISVAFMFAILLVAVGTSLLVWHELEVKDDALTFARTVDADSGLPNRVPYLEQLEARLAAGASVCLALMKIAPAVKDGSHLDPLEEAQVYRNAGDRIAQFLDSADMLARVSEAEFAVLFKKNDIARASAALELALEKLHAGRVASKHGLYVIIGSAVLTTCDSSIGRAAEAMRYLRDGLHATLPGGVQVLAPQRAAGVTV